MSLSRLLKWFMVFVVIFVGIAVVYDLVLWKKTRDRINKISSLVGMEVLEALKYLEKNRDLLQIHSVRRYRVANDEWLVVRLRKSSFLGLCLSWCCGDKLGYLEISGLVRLSVEDGRVTTSQTVF